MITRFTFPATVAALGVALLALTTSAHAQVLALDFSTSGFSDTVNNANIDTTIGWTFSVNTPVTVTALGLWDEGADGFQTDHEVGLWDSNGTLVASTTITSASTTVSSSSTDGQWLFNTISDQVLSSGTYTIGALFTEDSNDFMRYGTTASIDTRLGFGAPVWSTPATGTGLTQPTGNPPYTSPGLFGPNLQLNAVVVPEANTVALLTLALPVIGMVAVRRKK